MVRSALGRWFAAILVAVAVLGFTNRTASAQASNQYSVDQLVAAGSNFFGQVSGNLASAIEEAVARAGGLPNGYILGETVGGAFVVGARWGAGTLYTQNLGSYQVYWRGPSVGLDVGADASQVMMLVYNLPSVDALYTDTFIGGGANAFVVGGVGMTMLTRGGITIVPIVAGLGARLGVSLSYLKFSTEPRRIPF